MAALDLMEADFGGDDDAEVIAVSGQEPEVEAPTLEVEKKQKKEKKHKKDKKEKKRKEATARSPEEEPMVAVAPLQPCQDKKDENGETELSQTKALEEKLEVAAGCAADPPPDTPSTVTSEVSPETFVMDETLKQKVEANSAELEQAAGCAAVPAQDNPSTVTLEEKPKQAVEADGIGLWQVVEAVIAALEAPLEATEDATRVLEGASTSQDDGASESGAHADGLEDPQEPKEVKVQDAMTEEVETMGVTAAASLIKAVSSLVLEGAVTTEASAAGAHLEAPEHAEVPSAAMEVLEGASLIQAASSPALEGEVTTEAAAAEAHLEAPEPAEVAEGEVLLQEIAKEEATETSPVLQGGAKVDETNAEEIEPGAPELAEVSSEAAGVLETASLEEISKLEAEGCIEGGALPEEAVRHSASSQEGSAEAWSKFGIPTEAALDAALRGEGLSPMEGIFSACPEPLAATPGLPQLDYDYDGDCAMRPRPRPELQDEPLPKRVKLEQQDFSEITGTPEEVRLLMEAAEPLKDEASMGLDLPYSVEILAPPPVASGENPSMIELYGEALLSSRAAPEPLTSTPPWRLCREAKRHEAHSPEPHGETPYETAAYEAVDHGLAPDTPGRASEVPGVMLPTPSEVASREQVQSCLAAFQILASLDLPFADKLQVAWMVDNAKYGLVNVADYYDRCLREVVAESGLTEQHLGTLGVPLSVPRFPALPNYETAWYVNNVYPSGKVKRECLVDEEVRQCVLASELHIGSCQDPTQEGMRAVLQSMPPWYLLKSWVAARMNGPSVASEDLFMGFRGKEAIKVLERNEVEPGMIKGVCASHRDYVETLLDSCRIPAVELDALLEDRVTLESVMINEQWFAEKEDILVNQHGWVRSHRLMLAKSKRPDLYPGVRRELQEAKARGRALCLIPEEQAFSSWHGRPNRGRGGPYSRH